MAKTKFGLFYGTNTTPAQVIEGDQISLVGEVLVVYENKEAVGVFRLNENSIVRKVA
jgi:hypothetical protein